MVTAVIKLEPVHTDKLDLYLPEHIYSRCEKRFFAADEDNKKAETSVFSNAGLMAMVCWHDQVLFMANLRESGEKRYYALALLKWLFQELPASWTAGVVYRHCHVRVRGQVHTRTHSHQRCPRKYIEMEKSGLIR